MKTAGHGTRHTSAIIILFGLLVMLQVSFVGAQETKPTTGEPVMAQGIVMRVSLKRKLITVKPTGGKRIKLQVDTHTTFEKIPDLEALELYGRVQVWYTTDGDRHRAVKVIKLVDGRCS